MQESSITDAGMIIDVRCWKTAAVFNFMSLYFCPKRKIRNNRRPSAQIPLLNCLHPCCRWGHLIIYHLWSCFDGRTRPHHQFCQCVTSLREFSMKRSELSSSNCCCMSRPYSRAQHGVLTPAASINAHTVCLRTINMLLARSSCFSTDTAQHQYFQLADSWILENEEGSLKKPNRKLLWLQISVENQHRCQTFTPRPNARLIPFFFPAHSLPQMFQSKSLIKSPTLAQQVLHSSCVPRSQPL